MSMRALHGSDFQKRSAQGKGRLLPAQDDTQLDNAPDEHSTGASVVLSNLEVCPCFVDARHVSGTHLRLENAGFLHRSVAGTHHLEPKRSEVLKYSRNRRKSAEHSPENVM